MGGGPARAGPGGVAQLQLVTVKKAEFDRARDEQGQDETDQRELGERLAALSAPAGKR